MGAGQRVIQHILNAFYPRYEEKHKQPLRVLKAMDAQLTCRKKAQGSSFYRCPEDGSVIEVYHSCRNRGCTVCNASKQHQWLEQQKERLLNCGHFHLVFTLPSEYHALWLYNREWFIRTHFKVVAETLKTLLYEPSSSKDKGKKHFGATPGFISVLHTWGRTLNLHPHIHCIITAGGLTHQGEWKDSGDYLMPIGALKALYRGKFQAHIKDLIESDAVNFPPNESLGSLLTLHRVVYKKEWSINIQEKYEQGSGVMNYLSRYLGASPLKPQQIIEANDQAIRFQYKDHRDGRIKCLSLKKDEFMRRYLLHQAEPSVHTVRYYGLYASQNKPKRQQCEAILGLTRAQQKKQEEADTSCSLNDTLHPLICNHCGAVMSLYYVRYKPTRVENSIHKGLSERSGDDREIIERNLSG